jgi:hypothetical protein
VPIRRSSVRDVLYPIALAALAVVLPAAIALSDGAEFSVAHSFAPQLKPLASRPTPTTRPSGPRPVTPTTRGSLGAGDGVPATIDSTGNHDVTGALNAFLARVDDGATIVFPRNGRFRIEGTLTLKDRKNVTIKGQNATFFAKSDGLTKPRPGCKQDVSACRFPNRTRSQWSFEGDTNLLVRDVNVVGSNTDPGPNGAYKGALEAQHAFQILGGREVTLQHVSAKNVWGDLVNVGRAQSGSLRSPTNVTVENSVFTGASRQGWSITNGQHITFANNTLASVRRSLIDVEANVRSDVIAYVTIRDNRFGSYRFCTFTNYGAPAPEHDFVFSGNHSLGTVPITICAQGRASARRTNFQIVDNVGATGSAKPNEPMVSLAYFDNVVVKGNTQQFASAPWPKRGGVNGSPQAPVTATCSTVDVSDNTFAPRPAAMRESAVKPCG